MIGKFLRCLWVGAFYFLGLSASAVAVTKNIDVVVTHSTGSFLTTYTVKETSGKNQPAGMVYIAGQAFRRGDLPPGTYPVFRDAKTHAPLVQQLDEIATRRENGDDGSIRHLIFSVQLPAIPANGTYTMEIVRQTGAYSATAKQNLPALAVAHDLKLHLTDVRNQDGSRRGSGSLTFDINTAASNTGRDAPRNCATGPVRDCWIVMGPPVDDTTHIPDPLLYVTCYLDLTTASDQTSLGPVRHVCRVDNSWMNVSASNGGFPNDPQAISYRPQLLDGSSNLLDWSWLDASVNSSSNPVQLGTGHPGNTACVGSGDNFDGNWLIPGSTGRNVWYYGMPVLYSTTGTPPAGMRNNTLSFVIPVGLGVTVNEPNKIHLANEPSVCATGASTIDPTNQGSGTHRFAFRVWHTHWMSWYTLDQTGAENWTSGTGRTITSFYPAWTTAEQLYWKQSGTIAPLRQTVPPTDPRNTTAYLDYSYEPLSRVTVIGGSGVGARADLGLVNEWDAQAFLLQTRTAWEHMRVFSLASTAYPTATLLNEATGRIPVLNNGPPGPNHGGAGGSYPALGAPRGQVSLYLNDNYSGVVVPLLNNPVNTVSGDYMGGIWGHGLGRGFNNDHQPAFVTMMYTIFGSRHYLDAVYFAGNRTHYELQPCTGYGCQDNIVAGVHYYALYEHCCQRRGDFWAKRDNTIPAALGGDSNPERAYFNDILVENHWYEQAVVAAYDGSSTNYRNSLTPPLGDNFSITTFMDGYGASVSYLGYAMLRDPQSVAWEPKWINTYNALCSAAGGASALPTSYWCASYYYDTSIHDSSLLPSSAPVGAGAAYNGTDISDWGTSSETTFSFTAGSGTVYQKNCITLANGDTIKNQANTATWTRATSVAIDELRTDTWYVISNVDNKACTFQITNPNTGKPFTAFHSGGNAFGGTPYVMKIRPFGYNPPTGWGHLSYMPDVQTIVYGLKSLGFTGINRAYLEMNRRGFVEPGGAATRYNWDPTVVVP